MSDAAESRRHRMRGNYIMFASLALAAVLLIAFVTGFIDYAVSYINGPTHDAVLVAGALNSRDLNWSATASGSALEHGDLRVRQSGLMGAEVSVSYVDVPSMRGTPGFFSNASEELVRKALDRRLAQTQGRDDDVVHAAVVNDLKPITWACNAQWRQCFASSSTGECMLGAGTCSRAMGDKLAAVAAHATDDCAHKGYTGAEITETGAVTCKSLPHVSIIDSYRRDARTMERSDVTITATPDDSAT